jgi:hypothetical protein
MTARPLVTEIVAKARDGVARGGTLLVWSSLVGAGALALPLVWSGIRAWRGEGSLGIDATSPELEAVSRVIIEETLVLFAQSLWVCVVGIPLCYGATFMALAAVRSEPLSWRVVFAVCRRPGGFTVLISVLALMALVPTLLWLVLALVVGVVIGLMADTMGVAPGQTVLLVEGVAIALGLPLLIASVYAQGRILLAGLVLHDATHATGGIGHAIAVSWRLTQGKTGALARLSLIALWELLRGLTLGLIVGVVTRGLPMLFALVAATYDSLSKHAAQHTRAGPPPRLAP